MKGLGGLANGSSLTNAGERRLVDQTSASWNQMQGWLRQFHGLRELSRLSCA